MSSKYSIDLYEESTKNYAHKPGKFTDITCETSSIVSNDEAQIDTEDGPSVFNFRASRFQDSLRVGGRNEIEMFDINPKSDVHAKPSDSELLVVQEVTPVPKVSTMESRLVGRVFSM